MLKAKFIALKKRMENIGPYLGKQYTKALGKGLFEIRLKSHEGIARVFFCLLENKEIM